MRTTITYRDMLDQVSQATGASEGEYDNDAIVRSIIDEHGLVDVETLGHGTFWSMVLAHATSDPFAGIDENTEADASRPAVS